MKEAANIIARNNAAHEAAEKVIVDAVKSGVKITYGDNLKRKILKVKLSNTPDKGKYVILAGLNPTEKVKALMEHHKQLTRVQIIELSGLSSCSISRAARTLEDDGFITRGPSGQGIGREVLYSVVKGVK